jgi:type IV pilus assembly protein PilE
MTDTGLSLRRTHSGFSLIEMMVVVVIMGLIAGIGYPMYTQHVVKGKRVAAQAQMMELADREQQYMLANRTFAAKSDLTAAGYSLPSSLSSVYDWDVTVATGTPPSFTISFTPVTSSSQANDGTLSLTSEGVKSPADKWQ